LYRSLDVFDSPVLAPEIYLNLIDLISTETNYFYRCFDFEGKDLFPNLPLCLDHGESFHLVFLVGLVNGNRPGKVLLQGVAKVAGFKDIIFAAFEPLSDVPASLEHRERLKAMNNLRKRLRHSVVVLAQKANLESSQEVNLENDPN